MRHHKKHLQFSDRDQDHKQSLVRNLATQLFLHGRIVTTARKAKAVGPIVEHILTRLKTLDAMNAIRYVNSILFDEAASKNAIHVYVPKYQDRNSGYLREVKLAVRKGDNASTVSIEFV